jgi:hypothetical protein
MNDIVCPPVVADQAEVEPETVEIAQEIAQEVEPEEPTPAEAPVPAEEPAKPARRKGKNA